MSETHMQIPADEVEGSAQHGLVERTVSQREPQCTAIHAEQQRMKANVTRRTTERETVRGECDANGKESEGIIEYQKRGLGHVHSMGFEHNGGR
jgi:hypothetical protein